MALSVDAVTLLIFVPIGSVVFAFLAYLVYRITCRREKFSDADIDSDIAVLEQAFPRMDSDNWIRVSVIIKSLLDKKLPKRPGVLLLIKKSGMFVNLETMLAEVVNKALLSARSVVELEKEFFNNSENPITLISETFETHFINGGKVVIVRDIDDIQSPDVLTLFHSLCDNDYAKFKRVCFIFTVNLPTSLEDTVDYQQRPDEIRNRIFNEKWTYISEDKRRALVARVGCCPTIWM